MAVAASVGLLAAVTWYTSTQVERSREAEARAKIAEGQEHLKQGRPAWAIRAVERVPELGPWSAELLTVKGLAHAAFDRPEAARPLLERSLKLDPNQPMAAKVLAAIYFHSNEADRGFAMLERSARLDPDDFRPWFATGDMVLKFHLPPSDAVRAFKQALRLRPDHVESRTGLIDALLAERSTDEATPLLEAAIGEQPGDPRILRLAARHAHLLGRLEEMNRLAERALDHDPTDVEARVLHAQFLHRAGRRSDALSQAEQAVALDPDDLSALVLLAQIEGSLGMKARSAASALRHRKAQERAVQIGKLMDEMKQRPEDPEPRWKLARVAAEGGNHALAVSSYRAALALDPQCKPALDGLALLNRSSSPAVLPNSGPAPKVRSTPRP